MPCARAALSVSEIRIPELLILRGQDVGDLEDSKESLRRGTVTPVKAGVQSYRFAWRASKSFGENAFIPNFSLLISD
jgi:hypothetical protein